MILLPVVVDFLRDNVLSSLKDFLLRPSVLVIAVFGTLMTLITKASLPKHPPGPMGYPLVGNLKEFKRLFSTPEKELWRIAKTYGDLCFLWFGFNPVLVISSPEVAKDLMDKRGAIYSTRPAQNSFREHAWPWRLVTTPTGERFRLLRKVYNNLLGQQQSMKFRGYQDYEATVMIRDLMQTPDKFLQHTERFAISVIFSGVYGVRLVSLDHPTMVEFYEVWEEMLKYFQPGTLLLDYFPFLQKLPIKFQPWLKLANRLRTRECALHRAFLRTLKQQVVSGEAPDTFGAELVAIQKEEDISDEQAINILAMLIGAGADTTSSVLQSFFMIMALHPHVVQAAHQELDEVVGRDRFPTWDDEPNLPYMRALIKEVHRWAPIGNLGVPHATSSDDTYKSQFIPKGTIVFPNLTTLSRDAALYRDPDAFDPTRFLGDELHAQASALHPDFKRRDHFHYGFGRRLCQGIFVAEQSLYIVIVRLLWTFDIGQVPGGPKLSMDDKILGLVTKPRPYQVSLIPRSAKHRQVVNEAMSSSKTTILNFDDVPLLEKAEDRIARLT